MITAPATISGILTDRTKSPIYAVLLTSPDGNTTHEIVTASPSNGGAFATGSKTLRPLTLERKADPRQSRFTVSTFQFVWLDTDAAATAAIAAGIDGYTCQLYETFRGLDWASYKVTQFKGVVSGVPSLVNGGYRVTAKSAITKAEKRLFEGAATAVHAAMTSSQTTATVKDASGFQTSGWIRINSEDIAYTGKLDNENDTWTLSGLTRGSEGTTAAAHSADDKVQELFVLGPKHPFDIMSDVMTGTGEKTGLDMGDWDDAANLSAAKTEVGSSFLMYFKITQGTKGKEFIEQQILRPMSYYPIEDNTGLIGVKKFDVPAFGDFVDTLTESHAVARPVWRGLFEDKTNSVTVLYDYDPTNTDVGGGRRGKFDNGYTKRDASLIADSGKEYSEAIESLGIQSSQANTTTLLSERTQARIDRFGGQPSLLECPSILSDVELLELGDAVFPTFSDVISLPAASRSMTDQPCEIIGSKRDWRTNTILFTVLPYAPLIFVDTKIVVGTAGWSRTEADMEFTNA